MSQEEKETIPVSVVALRADAYTADGNVIISLLTKFSSAERKYSIPIECFHDLIIDLHRLNASEVNENGPKVSELAEPVLPLEHTVAAE